MFHEKDKNKIIAFAKVVKVLVGWAADSDKIKSLNLLVNSINKGLKKYLVGELSEINREPPVGISAGPVDDNNLLSWAATILGPASSPYKVEFSNLRLIFHTTIHLNHHQIYHPNIDEDVSICVGLLKTDVWKPSTKITQVLRSIASLLEHPNPDDALVASIVETYNTNKTKFDKTVKDFVKKYAS
ncbi:16805_t:CDS:2 [Entrophospora sp. SA101]|nr:16805_t:CDS:2 [Entrophospora sp. SA101]